MGAQPPKLLRTARRQATAPEQRDVLFSTRRVLAPAVSRLDISSHPGNLERLRIGPPAGIWQFKSIGLTVQGNFPGTFVSAGRLRYPGTSRQVGVRTVVDLLI